MIDIAKVIRVYEGEAPQGVPSCCCGCVGQFWNSSASVERFNDVNDAEVNRIAGIVKEILEGLEGEVDNGVYSTFSGEGDYISVVDHEAETVFTVYFTE